MVMAMIDTDKMLETAEFAELLADGTAADTIRVYCTRGIIHGVLVGRTWYISQEEFERFRKERKPRGRPRKAS